jgi:hypothetical protein
LLNSKIFEILLEARVLAGDYRREYNIASLRSPR